MPANTNPIFALTPNVGEVKITTTVTSPRSDGGATNAIGSEHFLAFSAGPSGSFVQRARFIPVATGSAINSIATTLRVFLSTISVGTPTSTDTHLLAEISVPIISAANTVQAANYYEIPLNIAIPANNHILVSQHLAQTTGQSWQAIVFGGNY